jgi:deoxyribodipyrimidine photo-lyase
MNKNLKKEIAIFWFRRDLRLHDNAGLYHALLENKCVLPIFIYDTDILEKLDNKADKRVEFINTTLFYLQNQLKQSGSSILTLKGKSLAIFKKIISEYNITKVYTNNDYEPSAIKRDKEVEGFLNSHNITFNSFKDQVIFEQEEITKEDGLPYTIFTPYSKKWKAKLSAFYIKPYPTENYFSNLIKTEAFSLLSLNDIGFSSTGLKYNLPNLNEKIISNYQQTRDIPSIQGTSLLSVHLRFGTVSIRELASTALKLSETWLNELIWRDFFMSILFQFPYVEQGSFKKKYNAIVWRNNEKEFKAWCNGNTGYPIVDAGMRELNQTGLMHNRVRMIVASFLTKHLLIDWRWGEAYFAEKLLDYDLSANNGNWQWAAGCGCDSAPYFRIFNPYEQVKRFDPKLIYINKWVKNLNDFDYPKEIVDHKMARERVLKAYKLALQEK